MPKPSPHRGLPALLAATALLLGLAGLYLWRLGAPPAPPTIGGPFSLIASTGQTVTDRDFRGRYMLLYFGYTACADVCPTTLAAMRAALDALGPRAARVQPLFITVDPRHDTPVILRAYTAAFSPHLIGLTGTQAQIAAAQAAWHIRSMPHQGNAHAIDHTSVLLLAGPDGRFIAPIAADDSAAQMATDLGRYLP